MAKKKRTPEQIVQDIEKLIAELKQAYAQPTTAPAPPPNFTYPSIYVDGACQSTRGGWGVVLYLNPETTIERGGRAENTTNNRMELQAAIEACQLLRELGLQTHPTKIPLYTDSKYVQCGITEWIYSWKQHGWQSSTGSVKNPDLWKQLDKLNLPIINWKWVKGHSGVMGNERADKIAEAFASGKAITLLSGEG